MAAPHQTHAVWLMAVGETLVWAGLYYAFAALLPAWQRSLGWDTSTLTLGLTMALAASALTAPRVGRLIDRGHGPTILPVAAIIGAALLAMLPLTSSPAGFVAIWALIGVTQAGCLYEPCFALLTRRLGTGARPAITRVTLVAGFASTLAFPLGTAMVELAGWEAAVWMFSGLVLVGAACLRYGVQRLPQGGDRLGARDDASDGDAARAVLGKPVFWLLAASFPMIAFNHNALINLLLPLLDARGVPMGTAVLAASLFGPMQVAGRVTLMTLGRSRSSARLALLAFAAMVLAACALLLSSAANLTLLFLFVALQGAGYGVTSILRPAVTAELLGGHGFGVISGRLALPFLIAAAAAPSLGALLAAAGGYNLMIVVLGLACTVGMAGLWVAQRVGRGAH